MVDTEEDSKPTDETCDSMGKSNRYVLREWKPQHVLSSNRTRWATSTTVSYKESSGSDSDYTPKPKRVKPLNNLREPSKDHFAAQRNVVSNRKDLGLPSITDTMNVTITDNNSSEQINVDENEPPKSTDTQDRTDPNSNPDIKNSKQDIKPMTDFTVMSSIHPRGHSRKPAHSKPTPHV